MAQVLVNDSSLEDIADAIREKSGGSDTYLPSQMAGAIRSIPTGVTGVKGDQESAYRTGDVNLTPANIGAKALQTPVTNPTVDGTTIAFISSITQNAQGAINAERKEVRVANYSQSGIMSKEDKRALDNAVNDIADLKPSRIFTSTDSVSMTIPAKGTGYKAITSLFVPIGARLVLTVPQGTAVPLSLIVASPYGVGNGSWYFVIYNNGNEAYTVTGTLVTYWIAQS